MQTGLRLCLGSVIPALFPCMVLVGCLSDMLSGAFRRMSGRAALLTAFLLGMSMGVPVGTLVLLRFVRAGVLDEKTAARAAGCCSAPSPAFLIGYAGEALAKSRAAGIRYLLLSLAVSALSLLWVLPSCKETRPADIAPAPPEKLSAGAQILRAEKTLAAVCGWIVLASALRQMLAPPVLRVFAQTPAAFLLGLTELAGGLADFAALRFPFAASAFLIGTGGLAVLLQQIQLLHAAGLSARPYLLQKLLSGGLSAALALCAAGLFKG